MKPVNEDIKKLLVLQNRDQALFELETLTANIPLQKQMFSAKIKDEKDAIESERSALSSLEVKRNDMRLERRSKEEKAASLNEQRQTLIKKPVEYAALERSIENLKNEASQIESDEIELLFEIDQKKEDFEKSKSEHEKTIILYENEIKRIEENAQGLLEKIDEARHQVREAEKNISSDFLQAYESLKKQKKRRPFLAAMQDGKCGGCHIKLSGELTEEVKKAINPTNCEMCGRLLYME